MINIKNMFIASDHAGFELKTFICSYLKKNKILVQDLGASNESEKVDYPDYGYLLARKIKNENDFGILICGSGIGISVAANRYSHIRAALCYDVKTSKLSRQHNNANVLALGGRIIKHNLAIKCVDTFLNTSFQGGRHTKRIEKLSKPKNL